MRSTEDAIDLDMRLLLFLILSITMINYFDRSAIAFAILPIQRDLGLSDAEFGFAASAFAIGYTVMIFFAGMIVDRFGSIKTWAISAIAWSIITILIGMSNDLKTLIFLRILLGVAEALHFPALLKTVFDWVPQRFLARAISLSLLGVPAATMIGAPFITWLMLELSWRWMFFVLGTLGIVWAIVWLVYFSGRENPCFNKIEIPKLLKEKGGWKACLGNVSFLANGISYFAFGYVVFFVLFWIPGYFEKAYSASMMRTAWLVALPWLMGSICILVGGWVSDLMMKKTRSIRSSRVFSIAGPLFISALCFFLLAISTQLEIALLVISLALGFTFAANAPIFAFNAETFPTHAGTAQGISAVFFSLSGIIAPAVTGWLVEISGNFKLSIAVAAGVCLIGSLVSFILQKPMERYLQQ